MKPLTQDQTNNLMSVIDSCVDSYKELYQKGWINVRELKAKIRKLKKAGVQE